MLFQYFRKKDLHTHGKTTRVGLTLGFHMVLELYDRPSTETGIERRQPTLSFGYLKGQLKQDALPINASPTESTSLTQEEQN